MTTYTSVFGGDTLPSSDNTYAAIALTADTTFFWPELSSGPNLLADNIDLTSTATWAMTFPDADLVSVGRGVAISNKGAFTVTIKGSTGATLGTIDAGVTKLFWLTDNTTSAGVWTLFTLGTGTSAADASALAGAGLKAISGVLAGEIPILDVVADLTLITTHRATCLDFTVASKTLTMMLASVAGTGFMVGVKNSTAGSVTITAAGSDLLDLVSTFNLSPQESCWLVSDGTNWRILNRGQSTLFQFTKLVKDISSATSFVLTSSEASNKLMQFIGTPTANTTIIVPSVVAVYYIQNNFTNNGFTLTIKTAAGTGEVTQYFDRVIVYCDGVNVVLAQSTDAAAAAASAIAAAASAAASAASAAAALVSENNAETAEANAETAEANAETAETNAGNSATLASQWAILTSGQVAATDYSSKAYAIGGTGVTNNIGASKEWATRTGSGVISGEFSAKEWSIGSFIRGLASSGSAKDWATYTGGTADNSEYSAKAYSLGGTGVTSVLGAAKEWAVTTGAVVIAGAYSAKEWAVGTFTRGAASGGSAKDWATYIGGTVDNAEYSAKKYSADAANYAAALTSTSTSSLTPTVGAQTFVTQAGKQYTAGQFFSAISASNAAVYSHGTITSYSGTSLVVNTTNIGTALAKADWNLSVSGSQGSKGDTGAGVPANLTITNPATPATFTVTGGSSVTFPLVTGYGLVNSVLPDSYPASRPSLLLDFANGKQLDPRITFTRASTGSYYGAGGLFKLAATNAARFDHDPVTGVCKGLLIEEARTNLLTYSESFDNAAWTKTGSTVTPNAITAPDGTLTADKLVEDTSSGHNTSQSFVVSSGITYTASIFAKAGTRTELNLQLSGATAATACRVNLLTGNVINISGTPLAYSVTPFPDGFYRVSVTQVTNAATYLNAIAYISNGGTTAYTGDGTSGLYLWGAQLEVGAYPTSYIPTTTAAATRSADLASMTGTNFSSWYNQTEGTFVATFANGRNLVAGVDFPFALSVSDGTISNAIIIASADVSGGDRAYTQVVVGGTAQAAIDYSSANFLVPFGTTARLSAAYKLNDFFASVNGRTGVADTTGSVPVVTQMNIGSRYDAGLALNGHISLLAYYPKRLTNPENEALSTQ